MEREFETKSGRVLHTVPVRWELITNVLRRFRLPIAELMESPDKLRDLSESDQLEAMEAISVLLNLFSGWGVTDNPDDGEMRELRALGFETTSDKVTRANWIRYIVMQDDEEVSALMGHILALSFAVAGGTEPLAGKGKAGVRDGSQ